MDEKSTGSPTVIFEDAISYANAVVIVFVVLYYLLYIIIFNAFGDIVFLPLTIYMERRIRLKFNNFFFFFFGIAYQKSARTRAIAW